MQAIILAAGTGKRLKEIISNLKDNISIWNINSYEEFFLQIFGKYKKDYLQASVKISNERDRFSK